MRVWWFSAERVLARRQFLKRATVPIEAFEVQMDAIEQNWPQIASLVGEHLMDIYAMESSVLRAEGRQSRAAGCRSDTRCGAGDCQ